MPDISEWGTANSTLFDPTGYLTSNWGTANATLDDPTTSVGGISVSDWGTANVTLINPSDGDWGTANATLFDSTRFFEWSLATGAGWVPARLLAFTNPVVPVVPGQSAWGHANATLSDPAGPATRDYLLQPYDNTSIWNTPLGIAADERPAGMLVAYNNAGKVTIDEIYLTMSTTAPIHPITNGTILNHNDLGPLSPTAEIGYPGVATPRVRIADNIIWDSSWNGIFGGVDADDPTLAWTGQALDRQTVADNPKIYRTGNGYPTGDRGHDDLKGYGRKGAHGGGQMGGIGGTLRAWEYDAALASDYMINHRLALNVWSQSELSQADQGFGSGLSGPGWRWPAYRADAEAFTPGAEGYYGRTGAGFDGVVMGSLLGLPLGYSFAANGITDKLVLSIGYALLNYGCHIVDSTGTFSRFAVSVENSRKSAWMARSIPIFHTQLMTLLTDLVLIEDCTPSTPGGAGSPRVPPPPALA